MGFANDLRNKMVQALSHADVVGFVTHLEAALFEGAVTAAEAAMPGPVAVIAAPVIEAAVAPAEKAITDETATLIKMLLAKLGS
jgi:hypothetical protein